MRRLHVLILSLLISSSAWSAELADEPPAPLDARVFTMPPVSE